MFRFTSFSTVNHYFMSEIYQPTFIFHQHVSAADFPPWPASSAQSWRRKRFMNNSSSTSCTEKCRRLSAAARRRRDKKKNKHFSPKVQKKTNFKLFFCLILITIKDDCLNSQINQNCEKRTKNKLLFWLYVIFQFL